MDSRINFNINNAILQQSQQEALGTFRLGVFEPEDLSDNAPLKLYQLCAKYIINNINVISFKRKIPSEVCDNLIEVSNFFYINYNY